MREKNKSGTSGASDADTSPICSLFNSRRLNNVLSINLTHYENVACTFNCVYCAIGRTILHTRSLNENDCYSLDYVKNQISSGLRRYSAKKHEISGINVAGIGEPTLYPYFCEAISHLMDEKREYFPEHPLTLFTNLSIEYDSKTFELFGKFDKVYCKLDAGDEKTFKRINIPAEGVSLDLVLSNLKKMDTYELSVAVTSVNYDSLLSSSYCRIVSGIKPRRVNLYELDRPKIVSGREAYFRIEKNKMLMLEEYIKTKTKIETSVIHRVESRGVHTLLGRIKEARGEG